jgi:hypothetical protein
MIKKELPLRHDSAIEYIDDFDHLAFAFLDERVRQQDQERAMATLMDEPVVFANMLKNNNEITEEERKDLVIELVATPGNVTVMIGAKRHGKTATVFWVIEELLRQKKRIYWYGFSPIIKKLYPQVIQTFDLKKVENGVLIVDEAAVFTSAKKGMTTEQQEKMAQIFTCGHADYSVVYISQTFRIDITILNTMDILWFKPFFQMDFDRETARDKFSDTYEYMRPVSKDENMVINCQENNSWFFTNELPKLWCDALSKPFSRIHSRDDADNYLRMLVEAGMSERECKMWLLQRGWSMEEILKKPEDAKKPQKPSKTPEITPYTGELPVSDELLAKRLKDGVMPSGMPLETHKKELRRRLGILQNTNAMMCPVCFSTDDIEGKGWRETKEGKKHRTKCWGCGFSGYDEYFKASESSA